MDYINIEPKTINLTSTKIEINILYIELNTSASIQVKFYSTDSKLLNTEEFILDGDDYHDWVDDTYLINYVCDKYNLQLL